MLVLFVPPFHRPASKSQLELQAHCAKRFAELPRGCDHSATPYASVADVVNNHSTQRARLKPRVARQRTRHIQPANLHRVYELASVDTLQRMGVTYGYNSSGTSV